MRWRGYSITNRSWVPLPSSRATPGSPEPRELRAGDVANIPANTRHWYGAARDCFFEHVVCEDVTPEGAACEFTWLEPVAQEEYDLLP